MFPKACKIRVVGNLTLLFCEDDKEMKVYNARTELFLNFSTPSFCLAAIVICHYSRGLFKLFIMHIA